MMADSFQSLLMVVFYQKLTTVYINYPKLTIKYLLLKARI